MMPPLTSHAERARRPAGAQRVAGTIITPLAAAGVVVRRARVDLGRIFYKAVVVRADVAIRSSSGRRRALGAGRAGAAPQTVPRAARRRVQRYDGPVEAVRVGHGAAEEPVRDALYHQDRVRPAREGSGRL